MLNVICKHNCKDCYALRVCALHAIKDQQGSIYVESDDCIGCGCCVSVCPTGALQARLDSVRGDISRRTGHGFAH